MYQPRRRSHCLQQTGGVQMRSIPEEEESRCGASPRRRSPVEEHPQGGVQMRSIPGEEESRRGASPRKKSPDEEHPRGGATPRRSSPRRSSQDEEQMDLRSSGAGKQRTISIIRNLSQVTCSIKSTLCKM